MKRGINADQIHHDILTTYEEIDFLQKKLDECTDEQEHEYLLDAFNNEVKKLHQLRNM